MPRQHRPTSRNVARGSDEETAILLMLIKRSQAGEFGFDDFKRHLSVNRHGAQWEIGDIRNGGKLYLLTDRQAAAVAIGMYRIDQVPSSSVLAQEYVRWPAIGEQIKPCATRPTKKLSIVRKSA